MSAEQIFSTYRYALEERADEIHVFGARIGGQVDKAALSRLDDLTVPQQFEVAPARTVAFDATTNKAATVRNKPQQADNDESATTAEPDTSGHLQATDNPEPWVPSSGIVQAFNNPDAPNGLTREMYHELTWENAASVARFEDEWWAYEHDFNSSTKQRRSPVVLPRVQDRERTTFGQIAMRS